MSGPLICWDPAAVGQHFNIEASSTVEKLGWDAFRQLHVPMRRIEVLDAKMALSTFEDMVLSGEERPFIDEDDLLRALVQARDDENFLIGVRGGPGSGKSHLIRWLEMRLREDGERFLPIPVSRELGSVGAVLNRIAEIVGLSVSYKDEAAADLDDLTDYLVSSIKVRLSGRKRDAIGTNEMRSLVRECVETYLAYRIDRKTGSGQMATPNLPMSRLKGIVLDFVAGDEAAGELCEEIDHLYTQAWMIYIAGRPVDMAAFMREVEARVRASGKRPVLLMEDITSFEVLHRQLLSVLTTLQTGGFIAVLGWTTAYERDNVPTNMLERFALRVSLTDESSSNVEETYSFREPEDVIRLTRAYMRAVRKTPCGRECLGGACTAGAGDDLYPFTEAGITRLYLSLKDKDSQAGRRTPRLLLSRVMQPLLDAAVTFGRFPRMDSVQVIDPKPVPAAYRSLGDTYSDWVQAKLWFATADTLASYFADLGAMVPDPEPVPESDGASDDRKPRKQASEDERARKEKSYRNDFRQLEAWLKGETLESADTWLKRLQARVPATAAVGMRPRPGLPVSIEGSGAARPAPYAVEVPRTKSGMDLLLSLAWRDIYGEFEANWDAVRVLGRLALRQHQAERDWTAFLERGLPIPGLLMEILALDAAFKGQLKRDDAPGVLAILASGPPDVGVPLLSKKTMEARRVLEPLAVRISQAFAEVYRQRQDTYDIGILQRSWSAYRGLLSTGKPLYVRSQTQVGTGSFEPKELMDADSAVRAVYLSGLRQEVERVQRLITQFEGLPRLGQQWARSVQQAREEYEKWKTPAMGATVMQQYQEAKKTYESLVPEDTSQLDSLWQQLRKEMGSLESAEGIPLKLSRLAALRPSILQASSSISLRAQEALRRIESEVRASESAYAGSFDAAAVLAALDDVIRTVNEVCS